MNGNEKDAEESVGSKQWMDVICKPPPVTLDDLAKVSSNSRMVEHNIHRHLLNC